MAGHEPPTAGVQRAGRPGRHPHAQAPAADRARRRPDGCSTSASTSLFLPDGRDVIVEQIPERRRRRAAVRAAPVRRGRPGPPRAAAARGPTLLVRMSATARIGGALFVTSAAGRRDDDDRRRLAARVAALARRRRSPGPSAPTGACSRSARSSGDVRLLDLRSGRVRRFAGGDTTEPSTRLRFTPDGRTLVTSDDDGQLIVWDVARGETPRAAARATTAGTCGDCTISPTDAPSTARGDDERAFVWDLAGDRRPRPAVRRRRRRSSPTTATALRAASRSARTAAPGARTQRRHGRPPRRADAAPAPQRAGAARLRRRDRLQPRRAPARGRGRARTGDALGRAHAAARGRAERTADDRLRRSPSRPTAACSPSPKSARRTGRHGEHHDGSVRVWDVRRRALDRRALRGDVALARLQPRRQPPRGRRDLAPHRGPRRTQRPARREASDPRLRAIGGVLARRHPARHRPLRRHRPALVDRSWKPVGRPLEGHDEQRFLSMEFTPDGTHARQRRRDGTVALPTSTRGNPIGPPLPVEPDSYIAADLSPDGSRLFAVSDRHGGLRWDIAPQAWKRHACLVAGRELTSREWPDALPGQPYRTVCRPA